MIEATAVIPVRLESTRLADKALIELEGRPLLWHVWQQALQAGCFSDVIVATDSRMIQDIATRWGARVIRTKRGFRNGTERIASIADQVESEHLVNVQGDMPWIAPQLFHQLLEVWGNLHSRIITPVFRLSSLPELLNTDQVKVVLGESGLAAYFSRQPIPFVRGVPIEKWTEHTPFWGHIGMYGLTQSALRQYRSMPPGRLEVCESLEQLRFLDADVPIATFTTTWVPIRVDNAAELDRARNFLSARSAVANSAGSAAE